jgi:hypothetical protein
MKQKQTKRRHTAKKRKTKKKGYVPLPGPNQCHPRVGKTSLSGGCLPQEVYTKALQSVGIPTSGGGNSNALASRVAKILGVKKEDQRTLLNALPLTQSEKEDLARKWLRPAMPEEWKKDPDMWLDSNNIRDVMKQYEEHDSRFKFLGPYPIDLHLRIQMLLQQKQKIV